MFIPLKLSDHITAVQSLNHFQNTLFKEANKKKGKREDYS